MKNKNETSLKLFFNNNKTKKNDKSKKRNKNTNLFMSKTFASKLFLKLTSKILDPIIVCLQTLKFEPENRKKEEIENTIPYLKTLANFNDYIKFWENDKTSFDLMVKFAQITFYQYYRKNTILRRPGNLNNKFFILLNGEINKYSLIFEKETMTLEQYLLYLIELEIINEDEIIKKCHALNQSIFNSGKDEISIKYFFKNNKKLNYSEMYSKAEKELIKLGYNSDMYHRGILKRVPSFENYLKIFENLAPKIIENDGKPKFNLLIGKYKLASVLTKGDFFNNITEENIKEYNLYLCKTNCDIGQISKEDFCNNELNILIKLKMKNIFRNIKNQFYFLPGMNDNKFIEEFAPMILYKKYKKGEKIFMQGELYQGVFLIYDGEISLSTKTNIDKLSQLLINVIYSIKSFPEHIPAFNSKKLIDDFNNKHQQLYNRVDIPLQEFLKMNTIEISKIKKNNILALCDSYDYKTELFNFTAECISDEAILFFITKNDFSLMLGKETSLYERIIPIIEFKIQFIVGKLRSFSSQTFNYYERKNKILNSIRTNSTTNILDNSKSNNSISNSNKYNTIIFNSNNYNSNNSSKISISSNKFNRNKMNSNKFNNSLFNNSLSYTIKTNFSLRNNTMRPLMLSKIIKEKDKKNINLNKNLDINYNLNSISPSSFYDTLNKRKTSYMKFNSLNNKDLKKKYINNEYHAFYDKIMKNSNSSQENLPYNEQIINSFRGTKVNKFINRNIIPISSKNSNSNGIELYPSYNEKVKNFEKLKIFPILKNRFFNNNKLKIKKYFM